MCSAQKVYSEEDVTFKYYQFINAASEMEFNSYLNEMAALSLYDTGVTAAYGDKLLTLSTCDYQEKKGRFVVAKENWLGVKMSKQEKLTTQEKITDKPHDKGIRRYFPSRRTFWIL